MAKDTLEKKAKNQDTKDMNRQVGPLQKIIVAAIVGFSIGSVTSVALESSGYGIKINHGRILKKENEPSLFEVNRPGKNIIFVENPKKEDEYQNLDDYLTKNHSNSYDQDIERTKILKRVYDTDVSSE